MKQFESIEKIDSIILYMLELASSVSVLLLAFGLIASMANVLTQGSVLTDNTFMQRVWAWTQCVAIDASVAGTIIRTFRYYREGERIKTWLYGLLSTLLLFTAAIVSNIESVQQTLNITLERAYTHVFIPVEGLIWIRSIAIVFLIVAHAMRHIHTASAGHVQRDSQDEQQGLSQTRVPEELVQVLKGSIIEEIRREQNLLPPPVEPDNLERVRTYLSDHPEAKVREVAGALSISPSTANKWMIHIREEEAEE